MEMISFDIETISGILKRFGLIFLFLWGLLICAIILDLWDGISTAKKLRETIKSHYMRITIQKTAEYWRFMLIAAIVDLLGSLFTFYVVPFASILFCLGLLGVEIKSLFEHAKRRKSRAVEMKQVIGAILSAATEKDAVKAYENIRAYIDTSKINNQ